MASVFDRGTSEGLEQLATARWARREGVRDSAEDPDGALHFQPGRIWLGVTPDDDEVPVGWDDDRHLVTIAGSRGGKGRSAIIPNLALYPGSIVCIDPKGENARHTAALRSGKLADGGLGQTVFVFDPFNVSGVPASLHGSFNPLAVLGITAPDAVEQAGVVADSLVIQTDVKDAHWDESAKAFIQALILHVLTTASFAGRRTLRTVRELLLHGDREAAKAAATSGDVEYPDEDWMSDPGEDEEVNAFLVLLREMKRNTAFPNAIGGQAQALLDMGPEELGSVLSTARRNTKFLDGEPIHRVLDDGRRPFQFDSLKRSLTGVTVYLCLPTRYLSTHARWVRLMMAGLMDAMERNAFKPRSGCSVLAICDEFPVLGHLKALETAVGYMAGYHLRIWAILQDISQLKRDYPHSWETFLGNAGLIQFFANSDYSTLEFLSKRLGEAEVVRKLDSKSETRGESEQYLSDDERRIRNQDLNKAARITDSLTDTTSKSSRSDSSTTWSEQVFKTPLITPDELASHFRRNAQVQGLICADLPPIMLRRINYDREDFDSKWKNWRIEAHQWRLDLE